MYSHADSERYEWLEKRAADYVAKGMAASLAFMHARVDWYREMLGGGDEDKV